MRIRQNLIARARARIALILLVPVAATVASCSSATTGSSGDATANRTLTVAVAADPRSLFANSSTAQQEINISEQITEKLVEFNAEGSDFEGRLATAWKQQSPTTVRLTLRPNVKFSNGEAFTAQSAKKSIETMKAAAAYKSFTSVIDHADVVDDHTLDVVSAQPTGLIMMALAMGSFQYPLDYWNKVGESGFGTAPMGTGPYMLDHWTKGVEVALKANPGYWGQQPGAANVLFKVIPDKSGQVAALQSGQVNFIYDVEIGSVSTLQGDKSLKVVTRPSNRLYYMTLSGLTDTPLKDPAVRRALQSAVDVKSIIDNQLGGLGTPLNGQLLAPNYFGYDPSVKATPYDPAKAKQLLAEAGYPNGFKVTFKYPSGRYAQDKEVGQALAAQLALVGVQSDQQVLESGTFLTQLVNLQLNDMFFSGSLPPPDAHMMYQQFAQGAPYLYYSDHAKVDALVAKDAVTADPTQRKQIISDITKVFQEDPPFIPMYQGVDLYAQTTNLTGFVPRASQFLDVQALRFSS
jgi:peptide/nickel transport system substrate-binding protein